MQSGLIVCGGDPSLWLDPAKTPSISPTDILRSHQEGAPSFGKLAPETVAIKVGTRCLMSATWARGKWGPTVLSIPCDVGFSTFRQGSSLFPVSSGPHIWAGERSERKGWDSLEEDHSFWDGEGGSFRDAGQCCQAVRSQPSVRSGALFVSHSDVSHFLRSGNSVGTRSRACYGHCVSCPRQNGS